MTRTLSSNSHGEPRKVLAARDPRARRGLLALLPVGIGLGIALWLVAGLPSMPETVNLASVWRTLTESGLSNSEVITAGTWIAWILLGYLALTTALRAILIAAEQMTGGARWARTALRFSNLITLPAVRRIVDGGVAGTLLMSSWLPVPSPMLAATDPAAVVRDRVVLESRVSAQHVETDDQSVSAPVFVEYTVVRGDSLWEIARRFYGDGSRYVEIFQANRERQMPRGERLTDPRLIEPGWVFAVPLPAQNLSVGDTTTYRVAKGDDLWSIAARFLGDGFRWVEIFDANQGHEMNDGRRFNDPSVISPGWILELPHKTSQGTPTLRNEAPTGTSIQLPPSTVAPSPEPANKAPLAVKPESGVRWAWPSLPAQVVETAAGFIVLGGAALFVHRLQRVGIFALRRGRRTAEQSVGDAGRVSLAANALASALDDLGFGEMQIVTIHESPRGLTCAVSLLPDATATILDHEEELARRLACDVEVAAGEGGAIEVTLIGFHRLAASLVVGSAEHLPLMVPVGADEDGIAYLNIAAADDIGIALDGSEQRQLLRAWVATLVTTLPADQLALRADDTAAAMIGELTDAPHFAGVAGNQDVTDLVDELDGIVQSRRSSGLQRPRVVAVLCSLPESRAAISEVLRLGPSVGVSVVALADASDALMFSSTVRSASDQRPDSDAEAGPEAVGGLILRVGEHFERRLEAVRVRRDTSPRWRESASVESWPELGVSDECPLPTVHTDRDASVAWSGEPETAMPTEIQWSSSEAPSVDIGGGPRSALAVRDREYDEDESPVPSQADAQPLVRAAIAEACTLSPDGSKETRVATTDVALVAHSVASVPRASNERLGVRQPSLFVSDGTEQSMAAGDSASALFTIRCLGGFEVETGGSPIKSWSYQKAPELLAFLVAHGRASVSRELVAEALWPDVGWDASLKHSLSNIATSLRSTLRTAADQSDLRILAATRQGGYELRSQLFDIDLDAFESSLQRAASAPDVEAMDEYDRAFALYQGDFLAELPLSWAEPYRIECRRRLLEAARHAAEIAVRRGERDRASRYYQLSLTHDPTDEVAARGRMKLSADMGDINGARKVYKVLSEAIQQELEDPRAGPSPETRSLLAELIEAQSA